MFDTLRELKSTIKYLIVSHAQLDDNCLDPIGEFLQDNRFLEGLDLRANKITDKGVEMLSHYIIGNITLKTLYLSYNFTISDASVPYFLEMAKTSHVMGMEFWSTLVSHQNVQSIRDALAIPIEQREIPLLSTSKSAAKVVSTAT